MQARGADRDSRLLSSAESAPDGAHRVTEGPPIWLAEAGGQILNRHADGALLGERRDGGGEGRHVLPESASLKYTGAGDDQGLLRSSQGASRYTETAQQ